MFSRYGIPKGEKNGNRGSGQVCGRYNEFLLIELTWVNQVFYLSVALGDKSVFLSATQHHSNVSTRIPIEGVTVASPFSHLFLAMLFFLFVYYLVQGTYIDASPIPSINNDSLAGNHCTDLTHCRSIWNIVWSCLVTIFSCTWVAVHPNVPCPKNQNPVISFAGHRLPLFICALLVPEYVLAWAIRQFLRAREIANRDEGEFKISVIFLPF